MTETQTRYVAECQRPVRDDWFIAGDIYGYDTQAEAVAVLEKWIAAERAAGRPVSAARIVTQVTTVTARPYLLY